MDQNNKHRERGRRVAAAAVLAAYRRGYSIEQLRCYLPKALESSGQRAAARALRSHFAKS